jgi:hypothetical protein
MRPQTGLRRHRWADRTVFLSGVASALIVVAVVAVLVHHGHAHGRGGAPVLTTPATISAGKGTGTQCPAGAYDGHCIVVPGGKTSTTTSIPTSSIPTSSTTSGS